MDDHHEIRRLLSDLHTERPHFFGKPRCCNRHAVLYEHLRRIEVRTQLKLHRQRH